MKIRLALLAFTLATTAIVQGQERRPTLGPSGPSENGPGASTTTNRQRLLRVRAIYVEPIDNKLSLKMAQGLVRLGWARVVDDREKADAVLSGSCFDSTRLKDVHSEVFINDRESGAAIWQDDVHVPYLPPPLSKAIDQTAQEFLAHLTASLRMARE